MSPTKKRKAHGDAANGTPLRKQKKMTQKEKQEALERANAWAAGHKAKTVTAQTAAPAAKKPAAKKKSSPSRSKATPSKKSTKAQQLQEAQERAATWAAGELQSPPPRKQPATRRTPAKATASLPPMLETNSTAQVAKVSSTKKKAAPKKKEAAPKSKSPVKKARTAAVETAVPVNDQRREEENAKAPTRDRKSWWFIVRLAVCVLVLIVALGLEICACACPAEGGLCALCDRITVFQLKENLREMVHAGPVETPAVADNYNDADKVPHEEERVGSPVVDEDADEKVETPAMDENYHDEDSIPHEEERVGSPVVDEDADEKVETPAVDENYHDEDSIPHEENRVGSPVVDEEAGAELEDWQKCRIFVAPSKLPNGGWGVFAAQDFEKGQMVEVPPMYVPMEHGTPIVKNSVLDDYVYGYLRDFPEKNMAAVSLGYIMMYNHDVAPNVRWSGFGKEPDSEHPNNGKGVGFVATRDIQAGEELFSSYGLEDGGVRWFETRGMERQLLSTEEAMLSPKELEVAMQYQCPKLYAGFGKQAFESRVMNATPAKHVPKHPTGGMPEQSAPFNNVVAKVPLKPGDLIEQAPAFVLHVDYIKDTPLAPVVFGWNTLGGAHRISLRELREGGLLQIQHQSKETNWRRVDMWEGYEKSVIFPFAGTIAMVDRAGINAEIANCRLEVAGSGSGEGSAPLMLRLVATKHVNTGEVLRLNMNPSGTLQERVELRSEMQRTGQPLFWIRRNTEG